MVLFSSRAVGGACAVDGLALSTGGSLGRMLLLRPRIALIGAAGAVVLLFLTWVVALHVGVFRGVDQSIFRGFYDLSRHGPIDSIATAIANLCNPKPYAYLVAIPLMIALARRRLALAGCIGAILLGANSTTELLKPLLAEPRPAWLLGGVTPVDPASWPSGHATAVMSWALCMILAVPPRLRPAAAAFGALLAVAVSYSFLVLGWHYPSDVLGGYLVAATWALLGTAALRATHFHFDLPPGADDGEHHVSLPAAITPPLAVLILAVLVAAVLAAARPHEVVAYARSHRLFIIGVAAIGVLALSLVTGMVLALRR